MKKYIFFTITLISLLLSVKVSAEPYYQTVDINNTNLEQPVCVWVGHEPTNPIDIDDNFWNFIEFSLDGSWEGNYMNINDSYLFGGFVGTCSSNIDANGNFIDESIVVETTGDVNGFLDYMVINFDGTFDIEVYYLDYDPTVTYPSEVELYVELYNTSPDETTCFYLNDDTTNAYEVLPGEYGWAYAYVNGEIDGGGWVVNYADSVTINAFAGTCSTNIDQNGVIDQGKVVTDTVSFDGLLNMIAVEFNGNRLNVDPVYMDEYDQWHDEHLEPANITTAIAISTVTTVASVGVVSAVASGTASTVATTVASSATSTATSTATTAATNVATNAMNAPRLQKRFKDRYVKGYKLNAVTSFKDKAIVGQSFTLTTKVLQKLSGGKTAFDEELTKSINVNTISEGLTIQSENRTSSGIETTFFLSSSFTDTVKVEVRITIEKKTIVQVLDLPVQM